MIKVQIYSKKNCCLCIDAKEMINRLSQLYPIQLDEIDITSEPKLLQEYENLIPVVKINGNFIASGKITEQQLIKATENLMLSNV